MSYTVASAVAFSNGVAMVFNSGGDQVPELQGPLAEVKTKILESADAGTSFFYAVWAKGRIELTRDEFERLNVEMAK